MATVYKYRVWCSTDSKYEYVWGETAPTTCPTNTGHTIDGAQTVIVEKAGNEIVEVTQEPAFKHKKLPDGNKLYSRTEGKSFALTAGVNDALDFNVPWNNAKLTGLEIIGGEIGDKVELKVRDDPSGTISTVADAVLNQFGYSVNVAKDFYRRESQYDADLIKDMKIELEYDSVSAKTIYVNYVLHEVKP